MEEYVEPDGKFGNQLGNVALVDCHDANKLIPKAIPIPLPSPLKPLSIKIPEIDFCSQAMQVYGVVNN